MWVWSWLVISHIYATYIHTTPGVLCVKNAIDISKVIEHGGIKIFYSNSTILLGLFLLPCLLQNSKSSHLIILNFEFVPLNPIFIHFSLKIDGDKEYDGTGDTTKGERNILLGFLIFNKKRQILLRIYIYMDLLALVYFSYIFIDFENTLLWVFNPWYYTYYCFPCLNSCILASCYTLG